MTSSSSFSLSSLSSVVVIGSGPTGVALSVHLKELLPAHESVHVFERHEALALGSPIRHLNAAQVISINVSERIASQWMNSNLEGLECVDEENYSKTNERPHLWNRASGQWQHARCLRREELFSKMQAHSMDGRIKYSFEKSLSRIEVTARSTLLLDFGTDDVREECKVVILAVPAEEALKIVTTLPETDIDATAYEVLERCSRNYELKYCRTVYIDCTSEMCHTLADKFRKSNVFEIDVSNASEDITLLSLNALNDGEDNGSTVALHVHSRSRDGLTNSNLTSWVTSWLELATDTMDFITNIDEKDDITCFALCKASNTPLHPLQERGYLVLTRPNSFPMVITCGDYASAGNCGTFTGALVSAMKAAHAVVNILK